MKTINRLIIFTLAFFTVTSCGNWLDVSPRAEIKEDEQFSNEQGFKDALYGVYQKSISKNMYGDNMTMGLLSALSYSYSNVGAWNNHTFSQAIQYNYVNEATKSMIDNMWISTYSTITQINLILKNVDKNRGVLSDDVYKLVKGEMLGMRAYLHFDMFRLFAATYEGDLTALSIPYVNSYSIDAREPLSKKQFIENVIIDLNGAIELQSSFKEIDQLNSYLTATTGTGTLGDNFMLFRQNRFNIWAAKATLARVYLYTNNKVGAAKMALEVINSKEFHLITAMEANETGAKLDLAFTTEHIFSLYASNLKATSDAYFTETISGTSTTKRLELTSARLGSLFETGSGGSSDLRYTKQWKSSGSNTYCAKYWQIDATNMAIRNTLPLLKLTEMYLIVAEANNDPSPINTVREARALQSRATVANLEEELRREYEKDTYAEGQYYFFYKRKGFKRFANSSYDAKFVMPIPDEELTFGKY